MTYRECDIGNGLRPGGAYSLHVYIEDESKLEGTHHATSFTVAQSPSNSIAGAAEVVAGFNASRLSVRFIPILKGFGYGIVVPRSTFVGGGAAVKSQAFSTCSFMNKPLAARLVHTLAFSPCELAENMPLSIYIYVEGDAGNNDGTLLAPLDLVVQSNAFASVSYTHLTLPTKRIV